MRLLGRSLLGLLTLLVGPVLLVAALLRPGWRRGLGQRLFVPKRRQDGPIWLHTASVGEAAAAQALTEAVAQRGWPLHLTSQTWSGLQRLRDLHPETPARLAPVDHPWWTRRALARIRPRALVLVESELWPSLVASAHDSGVPVVVVSGRISKRSFMRRRELDFFGLGRRPFEQLAAVGARSEEDAVRFVALGCEEKSVRVTGDLKWAKPAERRAPAPELAAWMSRRQTIVFGSTHSGEVEAFAQAMAVVRSVSRRTGAQVQWLWAPRHVADAESVLRRLAGAEIEAVRRTGLVDGQGETAEVLVLDTLGELAGAWPHALLAVVGGTFDETGGHDLLEPVHAGRPVLFGPHVHAVEATARALMEAGAAIQVEDGEELGAEILRLLEATRERADRVARATEVVERSRVALESNLRLVLDRASAARLESKDPDRVAPARVRAAREAVPEAPAGLYARERGARSWLTGALLGLSGGVYGLGARLHRGFARPRSLPCAVVSVGSPVVGGAGKTPAAGWVAKALRAQGHGVVLVTRGHGVRLGQAVVVASRGAGPCATAAEAGDEAVVLARRAQGVPVLVSRDRYQAGLRAVSEFGCDVLVLDDGFSHHRLHRDFDLVCLDGRVGLGNRRVLPAGPLREPASALGRADAVMVLDGPLCAVDAERLDRLAPEAPRFEAARVPRGWVSLGTEKRCGADGLAGRSAALLASVAEPSGFRATVAGLGVLVTAAVVRPDHHAHTQREIAGLGEIARLWVTTEKDAVKIDPSWVPEDVEIQVLEIECAPERPDALVEILRARLGVPEADQASATSGVAASPRSSQTLPSASS